MLIFLALKLNNGFITDKYGLLVKLLNRKELELKLKNLVLNSQNS